MKIDFFLRLRREKQNRKMILGSLLIILTFSKWSHSVPIPLAPSDRSTECSGHGRVVDGKCECEDTFLVRFFFRSFSYIFFSSSNFNTQGDRCQLQMGSNGYGIFVGDHSMRSHKEGECEHGTYVVVDTYLISLASPTIVARKFNPKSTLEFKLEYYEI